jgi:hypothetical protein
MSRDEVYDAVDKKQAMPDLVMKRYIFDDFHNMVNYQALLQHNFYKNGKVFNDLDIYRFRASILKLFSWVKYMAQDNGCINNKVRPKTYLLRKYKVANDYELCFLLEEYAIMDVTVLTHISSYIQYVLHELKLTNLLIDNGFQSNDDVNTF